MRWGAARKRVAQALTIPVFSVYTTAAAMLALSQSPPHAAPPKTPAREVVTTARGVVRITETGPSSKPAEPPAGPRVAPDTIGVTLLVVGLANGLFPKLLAVTAPAAGLVTCGALFEWATNSALPTPARLLLQGAAVVFAWISLHLTYLGWQQPRRRRTREPQVRELPSQQRVLDQLTSIIEKGDTPKTISLRGRWGCGKSTLIKLLDQRLSKKGTPVVHFDAWQHQADPSLEASLLCAIADHPQILAPWGWWHRPILSFLPASVFRAIREIHLGAFSVAMPPDSRVPEVVWRARLRAVLDSRASTGPVVLVLDEVDRCQPVRAQSYLTLIPRFLAVPGIVVIVPKATSIIQFKAFNPALVELPDLKSSMQALIFDAIAQKSPAQALGLLRDTADPSVAAGRDAHDERQARPDGALAKPLDRAIARAYSDDDTFDSVERQRLAYFFEEKFFASIPVDVPDLDGEDVSQLLWTEPVFTALSTALKMGAEGTGARAQLAVLKRRPKGAPSQIETKALRDWADCVKQLRDGETPVLTLRHVIGSLVHCIAGVSTSIRRPEHMERAAMLAINIAIRRAVFGDVYGREE
jgi:hypothetical protein